MIYTPQRPESRKILLSFLDAHREKPSTKKYYARFKRVLRDEIEYSKRLEDVYREMKLGKGIAMSRYFKMKRNFAVVSYAFVILAAAEIISTIIYFLL